MSSLQASRAEEHGGGSRLPKGVYDRWVLDVFSLSETVTPVDSLLRSFAQRFAEVHELQDKPGRGPWLLILEGFPPQGGSPWYFKLAAHAGLTDAQLRQFKRADLSGNALLAHAFDKDSEPIDLWYLPYYRERTQADRTGPQPFEAGLFDSIFGQRKVAGAAISGNAWLTAQPLQDHQGRIAHVVLLLYPNRGALFELSNVPPGAAQDQRVLDILAPVYKQLSGLVRSLAQDVERMKHDMIGQIGMGLINHEVGGMVRVLRGRVRDQQGLVELVESRYGEMPPEMLLLKESLALAVRQTDQLISTTHAFNNLERRGQIHDLRLQEVFDQVESLTRVRRAKEGVGVLLRCEPTELTLHSDATLLLHALLNLVINALNAFEEAAERPPLREVRLRAGEPNPLGEVATIWIEVANTGPPIHPDIRSRLFQRGATSRPHGHGQGLYLVRRIAQYCGGDAVLTSSSRADESVVFRLTIARRLESDRQLAGPSE